MDDPKSKTLDAKQLEDLIEGRGLSLGASGPENTKQINSGLHSGENGSFRNEGPPGPSVALEINR